MAVHFGYLNAPPLMDEQLGAAAGVGRSRRRVGAPGALSDLSFAAPGSRTIQNPTAVRRPPGGLPLVYQSQG